MNPITKVKLINELNAREAELGVKENASWHTEYKDSAWVYIGGFPYELTEGDVICVFSQYGEIVNINLVRDKKTGKSKGFCFVCFEDQRSTILAVDNLNGIKIKGRTIRVDHVANYKPPKDGEDIDDVTKRLREEGCAPKVPAAASHKSSDEEGTSETTAKKRKKDKKKKKKKEKEKEKEKVKRFKMEKREAEGRESRETSGISSRVQSPSPAMRVKKEKEDLSYEKYSNLVREHRSEQGEGAEGSRSRERGNERSHHRSSERDGRRRDGQDDRGNSSDRPERDTRPLRNVGGEAGAEQMRQPERRGRWDRQEEASDSRGDERDKSRKHERYSHPDSSVRYRERSQDRDRSHRDKDQHPRDTDRRRN